MKRWEAPWPRRRYVDVIRHALPAVRARRMRPNFQGHSNLVFEVDGRYIFRFPRSAPAAEGIARECQLLPRLAPRLPVSIPSPIVVGRLPGQRGWPFMAYARLRGRPLQWARLSPGRFGDLVRDLAPILAALARFPPREARSVGVPEIGRTDARREIEGLARLVDEAVVPRIPAPAARTLLGEIGGYLDRRENFDYRPTLLHGELHSSHVLWAGAGIHGIIDWGAASIGDPARELAPWVAHFGTSRVPLLMEGRVGPRDRTFLDRARFYRLLIPMIRIRDRMEAGDPQGTSEPIQWLRRALRRPATAGWSQ